MAVIDILKEQDEMKAHEHHFILWPRQWKKYVDTYNWTSCSLDAKDKELADLKSKLRDPVMTGAVEASTNNQASATPETKSFATYI